MPYDPRYSRDNDVVTFGFVNVNGRSTLAVLAMVDDEKSLLLPDPDSRIQPEEGQKVLVVLGGRIRRTFVVNGEILSGYKVAVHQRVEETAEAA